MITISTTNVKIIATKIIVPYYMYLREDGIVYIRISNEKEETVELTKQMVIELGKMVNYKKVPLLAEHEEFALPGKENRDFWAKKESCPYSSADAFMIGSTGLMLIANVYLRINKPERPTKMFTNKEEAIRWLKTFL